MKKQVIGTCPICHGTLTVTELSCAACETKLNGEFRLSKFDYLTREQQEFALIFLKDGGNIKLIEKDLNISYPTVKKLLSEVVAALGFANGGVSGVEKLTKEEIYNKIKSKELTIEQAEKLLTEVQDE